MSTGIGPAIADLVELIDLARTLASHPATPPKHLFERWEELRERLLEYSEGETP